MVQEQCYGIPKTVTTDLAPEVGRPSVLVGVQGRIHRARDYARGDIFQK